MWVPPTRALRIGTSRDRRQLAVCRALNGLAHDLLDATVLDVQGNDPSTDEASDQHRVGDPSPPVTQPVTQPVTSAGHLRAANASYTINAGHTTPSSTASAVLPRSRPPAAEVDPGTEDAEGVDGSSAGGRSGGVVLHDSSTAAVGSASPGSSPPWSSRNGGYSSVISTGVGRHPVDPPVDADDEVEDRLSGTGR